MADIGLIMAKELTWKDIVDGCHIKDEMEQQIFLLSRFFKIPREELAQLPLQEIHPMMLEMNEYFEGIDNNSGFKFDKTKAIEPNYDSPNYNEPVESRSQILDL